MNKKQKKMLVRIAITAVLFISAEIIEFEGIYEFIYFLIPYLVIGYDILYKAIRGVFKGQLFDENFLMAVATVGAIGLKEYDEGVAVMLFYQIGEFFQSYAIKKSRKSISDLMDIRPDIANLLDENGDETVVNPADVPIGSYLIVKVGEKIPIDGIVISGESTLNTSALTGESRPRDIKMHDEVISGCINMTSPIKIKTTKSYDDSTVAKVLDLIENATSNKSKSEDFITKFAKYYTPIVCYAAMALVIIPPLYNIIRGNEANFSEWLLRAFSFLVISCPCALVISIPLSFFAGIGGASNKGILIKGSNHLENLAKVKYLVFDKTGTMTKGVFEVNGIHHNVLTNEKLLEYAALSEIYSNHPIAMSIKKAYGRKLKKEKVESIKEIPGEGIISVISGKNVLVGNEKLLKDNGVEPISCKCVGTIVHIAVNNEYMGHILINDIIKPTSAKCIRELKKTGIKETVMLTGDLKSIADNVKKELGIDEVYSELLPDEKVSYLEKILERKEAHEMVGFVGDGINDAPVIARSDIGIAMGALGSDAAIEAADVVLMDDDPIKIVQAIRVSRNCLKIVYENIWFAIIIKVLFLLLSAIGKSTMWMAIFADVGVMIICVLNAIRALYIRRV